MPCSVAKLAKDRKRIVANGEERHVPGGERGKYALQLDELRLAERSPLRAAVEDDEGRAAATGVVEIDHCARLIGEADVRKALAFDRTDSLEVPGR